MLRSKRFRRILHAIGGVAWPVTASALVCVGVWQLYSWAHAVLVLGLILLADCAWAAWEEGRK